MAVKKKQTETQELSKTRQILWRFSKVHKNVEDRRTTFSELFFDLAVVFIFSLLASRLMGSLGHGVIQEVHSGYAAIGAPETVVLLNNRAIGIAFWIAHFFALWFTWYQFSNYSKYHWINNLGNNILTLFLIFTLILQGAGIYFGNPLLTKYSLIISFVAARFIFVAAQYTAVYNSASTPLTKDLKIKVRRQAWILVLTSVLAIIYISLNASGYLEPVVLAQGAYQPEYIDAWKAELFLSIIIFVHLGFRGIWKLIGSKHLSEETYKIVFHTKERHHLFIIIAIGELIVVTLTSSFVNNVNPILDYQTLIYMFTTPFIGMAIWYLYKAVFYKASPVTSKKNYYLYLTSHVFLVLGLLILLGSMKSHMMADAYTKATPDVLVSTIVPAIEQTSRTYYSLGIVIGITLIISSMAIYAAFVTYAKHKWANVIKAMVPYILITALLFWVWLFTAIALFWLNIQVPFSTEMYILIGFTFVVSALLLNASQRITKSQFDTVEEYDEYTSSLDQ